ncbi:MAG TPA: family 16 glycoside hydrolase, partial [Bryobacteraceae bacterium]|nr:family 16 glycoside hydrolase [Bryobacteraceae bacterium]
MKRTYVTCASLAVASGLLLLPLFGVSPSFKPDSIVKGSGLSGWHTLGQAGWRIQNGEITGVVKAGHGGWLVSDQSWQDVALNAAFRCAVGCKTGVLLRAEKTPQGMKGIFVSLTAGDVAPYRVTLDAEGQELTRERLRLGGGQLRIAPPADPNPPGRGGGSGRGPAAGGPTLPLTRPVTDFRTDDWNQVEVLLDVNVV